MSTPAADAYTVTGCDGRQVTVLSPQFEMYTQSAQGEYDKVLESGEVQYTIAKFDSMGYALDLPNSFIVAGSGITPDSTDTIAVRIVNVILRYLPDSSSSFVWISHRTILGHLGMPPLVDATICSFVNPTVDIGNYEYVYLGADSTGVGRGMWIKPYVSPLISKGDVTVATKGWKDWGLCVVIGTVVGCVLCGASCTISGPAWAPCTVGCCGLAALASEIACTICMIFC